MAFSVTDKGHGPGGDRLSVRLQIQERESFISDRARNEARFCRG
jgi:hypothetical protein